MDEYDDVYEVAQRLWDVHTLDEKCAWDTAAGFADRTDVLQDVINVLDLRWAWQYKPDWEIRKGRGGLSADDESLLRCMMRRYGQELLDAPTGLCEWSQCFEVKEEKKKKFIDFAWFLVQQLLHPRDAVELAELRRRHDPVAVRSLRASRMVGR
eukprot:s225_g31.t1